MHACSKMFPAQPAPDSYNDVFVCRDSRQAPLSQLYASYRRVSSPPVTITVLDINNTAFRRDCTLFMFPIHHT